MQPYSTSSTTCVFTNPVNLSSTTENYAFSTQTCITESFNASNTPGLNIHIDSGTSASSSISGSSSFSVVPVFTGGDIIIITLMLIFLFLTTTAFVIKSIDRIKTKKMYIRYSNADVEMSEEN